MKFSIVTISYNQSQFLEEAIRSVIGQDYSNLEYIVVDPGSTDDSRAIIEKYRANISTVVLEPDRGPADGLNKGFKKASGELYGFLNSDDYLLPGALRNVADMFASYPQIDVVSGHAMIVDHDRRLLRYYYSDHFDLKRCAYGQCILMQPSTFLRARAFANSQKFNSTNRSNWDGELWVDLALQGARFKILNHLLSAYRVHAASITGSGSLDNKIAEHSDRMFRRIMHRQWRWYDSVPKMVWWATKQVRNPRNLGQRILRGPVYRAG